MNLLLFGAFPSSSMAGASTVLVIDIAGGEGEDANSTRAEEGTARIPEIRVATAGHGQHFMLAISPC